MSGFEFAETMTGSFRLMEPGAEDRPLSFSIRARSAGWLRFLSKPEVEIEGEVDAEGFADHRLLRGTLGMDLVRTRRLPYAFRFTGNDGAPYAFVGEKILKPPFTEAMTVLPGRILDAADKAVAEALLRFDLRGDLSRFLRSFRRSR